jgi:hypothetical protein
MTPCRTPEGNPLFCRLCRAEQRLEVSILSGDATCPRCGTLLWENAEAAAPLDAEATKRMIRGLVAEIATHCKEEWRLEVLLEQVLPRTVQALAAIGGAIWQLDADGFPRAIVQQNMPQDLPPAGGHAQSIADFATRAELPLEICRQPQQHGNPTPHLQLVATVPRAGGRALVVEILQRAGATEVTLRGYRRFLGQICEMLRTSACLRLEASRALAPTQMIPPSISTTASDPAPQTGNDLTLVLSGSRLSRAIAWCCVKLGLAAASEKQRLPRKPVTESVYAPP